MKIALLSAACDIHTLRWANGLAGRGHAVDLISLHRIIQGLDPKVRFHQLPFHAPAGYYLNTIRLRKLLRRIQPDLLNAHYASGYGTLARLAGFSPAILSVWGSDVFDFPESSTRRRRLVQKNLRAADRVFSTSRIMAEQVHRLEPTVGKVHLTPFGVDTERFKPRKRSRPRNGPLVVGTVKKLAPKYGIDILLRAFAAFQAGQDCHLRIAGEGPQEQELKTLARSLGLEGRVQFLGRIEHDRVPEILQQMDVFAALSRLDSESFGVSVLEASACGLPVAVSEAGGLPEVVLPETTGLLVPRDDVPAAAAALERLVRDGELRRRLGAAGRRFVQEHYAWERCLELMEAGYGEVYGSNQRSEVRGQEE